jgi:hypothetical protein
VLYQFRVLYSVRRNPLDSVWDDHIDTVTVSTKSRDAVLSYVHEKAGDSETKVDKIQFLREVWGE